MSTVTNLASGVEMTLLMNSFVSVRSHVGVVVGPSYVMRLPPTVRRTRWVSALRGRTEVTMWPYVMWLRLSGGMEVNGTKVNVLVGRAVVLGQPCARRASSLAYARCQVAEAGLLRRDWYEGDGLGVCMVRALMVWSERRRQD